MGKKILIVDDDRTMTNLLKTLLELDDFEVKTVTRGGDAISQATSFQPEAFIVDFHLHDMEGVELVQQLRTLPAFANSLIIIASGMDKEAESLAAGANRFLLKPYDPDSLSKLLKEAI
ncbi:MAG: response regulator [Chloroflexi bacterium]|uniref:response regulator n=1 Tax=Candidatus Flexifilum breve TaxID=3140694 RepID=UPI0031372569|nr:response regulator [Chloroflexota bacterium]MBK9746673.1 response regulator [Chloroflexota bacterium]